MQPIGRLVHTPRSAAARRSGRRRLHSIPLALCASTVVHSPPLQVDRLHRKLEDFHVSDYNALRRAYTSLSQVRLRLCSRVLRRRAPAAHPSVPN